MTIYVIAYYLTLSLFFGASFFPIGRLWGFAHWAYLPLIIRIGLFLVGAVLPLAILKLSFNRLASYLKSTRMYIGFVVITSCLSSIVFYLLRARTFFDGDGYLLISYVVDNNPVSDNLRTLFTLSIVKQIYSLLGANGQSDAIMAFQIVAIGTGLIFIVLVASMVRQLFEEPIAQITIFIGILTAGQTLFYFGHVEYYAFFILAVTIFTLAGLGVLRNGLNKWWLISAQILAIITHVFGLVLIPATILILIRDSLINGRLSKLSRKLLVSIVITLILSVICVIIYKSSTDLFFKLIFVPLVATKFTHDGYTMFSGAHLLDGFSLMITLFPGLLIATALCFQSNFRSLFYQCECRWLLFLSALTLGTTFVIDPKLGMARDWNLFAFSMIPVIILFFYTLSIKEFRLVNKHKIAFLMGCLAVLTLFPRAYADAQPEIAVAHFKDYLKLDKSRGRLSRVHLVNFYKAEGDIIAENKAMKDWNRDFPEKRIIGRVNELYGKGRNLGETIKLLHRVLDINPTHSDAYNFLGICYLGIQNFDSALILLEIADGLNPDRLPTITGLGLAYKKTGDFQKSISSFERAIKLDGSDCIPFYNIALIKKEQNEPNEYLHYLEIAATRNNAFPEIIRELFVQKLINGEIQNAVNLSRNNPTLKTDSLFIFNARARFPAFDSALQISE